MTTATILLLLTGLVVVNWLSPAMRVTLAKDAIVRR